MEAHPYAGIAANMDVKAKAEINSWKDCADFLAGAVEKTIASNVKVRHNWSDDTFGIILYDTEIVRYYKDKTFTVSNGGFNTPTTRQRVTQFTPDGYFFFHDKKKLVTWGRSGSVEGTRLPNDIKQKGE